MKRNLKSIIILFMIMIVFCITVGYAYLTSNLSIVGTSGISSATWNVYWDNVQVTTGSVTGDQVTQAVTIDSGKTNVAFGVTLSKPGDYYEFTVDAVNDGTIDAKIDTILNATYEIDGMTSKELPNYLEYSFTYSNGSPIKKGQFLESGKTKTYKVRVQFKKDISAEDLPSTDESIQFQLGVDYVQGQVAHVTDTIYWALQDGSKTLVISSNPVTGVRSGSFSGDTVFNSISEVPWIGDSDMYEGYQTHVTTIKIEGTVVPESTAFWFSGVGISSNYLVADLDNLNTSRVTSMNSMFSYMGASATTWNIGDISQWDTSNVVNMQYMFSYSGRNVSTWNIGDISQWDTSNVVNMQSMFYCAGEYSSSFELNISGWNTSNVSNMTGLFLHSGYRASTWSIIIPQTNGGGINNTAFQMFGSNSSISTLASESNTGRRFTLASS